MPIESALSDEAQHLSQIPMFKQLDSLELENLANCIDQVTYRGGEDVFNEHDCGDALYIVESGSVRVWVRDEDVQDITLSELKPGDFFGELSVFDGGERSANATAIVDTVLHRLSRQDFQEFLVKYPDAAVDVIREIGARMRQTNALVSKRVTRNINRELGEKMTIGQKVADQVAAFGGSWT